MITDEEVEEALERAIETASEDISRWVPSDIDPLLAKDPNGRYILLEAYTALANFRASRTTINLRR